MKPSLLDLTSERRTLEELLVESGGDECAAALALKVESYASLVMDWQAAAQRAREASKACKAKADALDAACERLLARADMALGPDRKELRGEAFRLVRRDNPVAVEILDIGAVLASCPQAVKRTRLAGHFAVLISDRKAGESLFEVESWDPSSSDHEAVVDLVSVDKVALKAAIQRSPESIVGAVLTQGSRIEIKP
jgi:hypothetical protein